MCERTEAEREYEETMAKIQQESEQRVREIYRRGIRDLTRTITITSVCVFLAWLLLRVAAS